MTKLTPQPYVPYILVADDDAGVRGLYRRIIEEAGYLVFEAANGRAALRAAHDRFFDVLVVDLSMPDMDGFELLESIRHELPGIRVLIISGMMRALLPTAKALGATATLDKAVAGQSLLPLICSLLTR